MKKLLFTLFVVSTSFLTFGQKETVGQKEIVTVAKKETFIIKFGANQSYFKDSQKALWEGKTSYNLGVAYEIPLKGNWYIQPEINYYRLDAKATGEPGIVGNDILKVSLIGLTPVFKNKVSENLYIEFGPELNYISYVARARHGTTLKEKPNRKVKDFSRGIVFGLSYDFSPHFGLEARYHLGLTEVDERPGVYLASYTDSDLGKISLTTINLFYKF